MNADLLRNVARKILADPEAFDMYEWIYLEGKNERILGQPCGTVGCIAGHTCILGGFSVGILDSMEEETGHRRYDSPLAFIAQGLLQITRAEADGLFYVSNWPHEFEDPYDIAESKGLKHRAARIAVARINAFLAEKGYAPVEMDAAPAAKLIDTVPTFAML